MTVDMARALLGSKPHPDKARGANFIYEEEEFSEEDQKIPAEVKAIYPDIHFDDND